MGDIDERLKIWEAWLIWYAVYQFIIEGHCDAAQTALGLGDTTTAIQNLIDAQLGQVLYNADLKDMLESLLLYGIDETYLLWMETANRPVLALD